MPGHRFPEHDGWAFSYHNLLIINQLIILLARQLFCGRFSASSVFSAAAFLPQVRYSAEEAGRPRPLNRRCPLTVVREQTASVVRRSVREICPANRINEASNRNEMLKQISYLRHSTPDGIFRGIGSMVMHAVLSGCVRGGFCENCLPGGWNDDFRNGSAHKSPSGCRLVRNA